MAEAEYIPSTVVHDADIALLSCRTCSGELKSRVCWLSMPPMKIKSSPNPHLSMSHGRHNHHDHSVARQAAGPGKYAGAVEANKSPCKFCMGS